MLGVNTRLVPATRMLPGMNPGRQSERTVAEVAELQTSRRSKLATAPCNRCEKVFGVSCDGIRQIARLQIPERFQEALPSVWLLERDAALLGIGLARRCVRVVFQRPRMVDTVRPQREGRFHENLSRQY